MGCWSKSGRVEGPAEGKGKTGDRCRCLCKYWVDAIVQASHMIPKCGASNDLEASTQHATAEAAKLACLGCHMSECENNE